MLEDIHHLVELGRGKRSWRGIVVDEIVEERDSDCAAGFGEENTGEEEVEGVGGETLLDEAKGRGGEWWEGNNGRGGLLGARRGGKVRGDFGGGLAFEWRAQGLGWCWRVWDAQMLCGKAGFRDWRWR